MKMSVFSLPCDKVGTSTHFHYCAAYYQLDQPRNCGEVTECNDIGNFLLMLRNVMNGLMIDIHDNHPIHYGSQLSSSNLGTKERKTKI